jgi:hypothetical protein
MARPGLDAEERRAGPHPEAEGGEALPGEVQRRAPRSGVAQPAARGARQDDRVLRNSSSRRPRMRPRTGQAAGAGSSSPSLRRCAGPVSSCSNSMRWPALAVLPGRGQRKAGCAPKEKGSGPSPVFSTVQAQASVASRTAYSASRRKAKGKASRVAALSCSISRQAPRGSPPPRSRGRVRSRAGPCGGRRRRRAARRRAGARRPGRAGGRGAAIPARPATGTPPPPRRAAV